VPGHRHAAAQRLEQRLGCVAPRIAARQTGRRNDAHDLLARGVRQQRAHDRAIRCVRGRRIEQQHIGHCPAAPPGLGRVTGQRDALLAGAAQHPLGQRRRVEMPSLVRRFQPQHARA
jgi:hypothetical protein